MEAKYYKASIRIEVDSDETRNGIHVLEAAVGGMVKAETVADVLRQVAPLLPEAVERKL